MAPISQETEPPANPGRFIEPFEGVYTDPEFSFLVYDGSQGVALVTAQLLLQPLSIDRPDHVIEAGKFYGFSGHLTRLGVTPRELVDMLLNGRVPAPDRTWLLASNDNYVNGPFMTTHQPGRGGDNPQHERTREIVGNGLSIPYSHKDEDDWSLRAATTPYSNLRDLLMDLRLPTMLDQFRMVAFAPVVVDVSSRVRGEVAELKLLRSKHLPVSKMALAVITRTREGVTERTRIAGDQFEWSPWEQSEEVSVGTVKIPVQRASVLHCLAVFDQHCLHQYWVGDPDASQNLLRQVYQLFDPRLEDLFNMITQPATRGDNTAQEGSVAALLWLLGFAPLHVGQGRLSDAPDVIAISADGHFLVVECTLDSLQTKKQNKPQKLLDRTNEIRVALVH